MSDIEIQVARHYGNADLTDRVKNALRKLGIDPENATPDDLKAGDEFHTGGVLATDHLFEQLEITPEMRVLDVGSGIGGTARYIADRYGAHVVGVDLTPDFVTTARALSAMVGLSDRTEFHVGSALDMPVGDAQLDLAVLMHVGMNIADKHALLAEIAAKLKPGGTFALFEVMQGEDPAPLEFPLPWSGDSDTSFLAPPSEYRAAAEAAGLVLGAEEDRSAFAIEFFRKALAKAAAEGPAPLGIHLMMGETARQKLQNYLKNLEAGRTRPVEMIFTKP